jgi:site-specific recombinase XerD
MNFEELFTLEELELMLDREERYRYLDHRNRLLISLLIYQGLASEEITRLNVSDMDLDDGTVRVRGSRSLNGRVLPLRPSQVTLVTKYLEDSRPFLLGKKRPTSRLFLTKVGSEETVDGIHAMVEQLKALFPSRKLCPSTIRMSVISYWLNVRKIPVEDVQQMAGHKWPSSTERYKRADMDEQRNLLNQFHPLQNFS